MDDDHKIGAHQDCGGIVMGRPVVPLDVWDAVRVAFWCAKCGQEACDVRLQFDDDKLRAVSMVGPAG